MYNTYIRIVAPLPPLTKILYESLVTLDIRMCMSLCSDLVEELHTVIHDSLDQRKGDVC